MTASIARLPQRGGSAGAARPGAAGTAPAPARSAVARIASALATLALVLGALALVFMTVAPRVFHYRTATMLTGSMAPGIKPGDVIVDTLEPTSELAAGQIITYHIPVEDHRVESHRVIWVRHAADGAVLFRTKGDANNGPDPWTARADGTQVWRVRGVVPVAGTVIRALRQPVVHLLLAEVLPVLLVLWLLVGIWRPKPAQDPGPSR
ncbi:MAG TPA: signal peptidase I [Jatrophihabitans sp.]|nr:signal peptidase I [Jatrophihabitans sp.]